MIGLDPARTNYAGKIPSGLDLPSDVADEKHLGEGVAKQLLVWKDDQAGI